MSSIWFNAGVIAQIMRWLSPPFSIFDNNGSHSQHSFMICGHENCSYTEKQADNNVT